MLAAAVTVFSACAPAPRSAQSSDPATSVRSSGASDVLPGQPARSTPEAAREIAPSPGEQGGPAVAGASAAPTERKSLAPYAPDGSPRFPATSSDATVECFTTSIAVPVAGVYRCLSGNTLLDPCFAPAGPAQPQNVTCYTDPWTPGVRLTLSGALPGFVPVPDAGNPWALELANGAHCLIKTGTVSHVDGVDLAYTCDTGDEAGVSADGANLVAHQGPAAGPLQDVAVSVAWRGQSYRY